MDLIADIIAAIWNRVVGRRAKLRRMSALELGLIVADGQITTTRMAISNIRRTQHIAVLGKTGYGKSSLLKHFAAQDIAAGLGFIFFDIHGDASPFILRTIAQQERISGQDLSTRLIVIEPADPEFSVGLNILEPHDKKDEPDFVKIAEAAQVLKSRWHLDGFGPRTDELLRNSLFALAANGHTLVELAPFLTNASFRTACLEKIRNNEVRQYFTSRYDVASEPMRRVMADPILNKTSAFTADPHFRHIVGQKNSTFSLRNALDESKWILVNLDKGQLGEQSLTLGSLLLATIKNTLFSRRRRDLVTIYADEVQNLVAYDVGLETILSESRKFGVSVISANQYLDQYPPAMRAAIFSLGTHIFFQVSGYDAGQISTVLDGGKHLAEALKNLRPRHLIVKSGHERWQEIAVPTIQDPAADYTDLYNRSRTAWARSRQAIDRQIADRLKSIYGGKTKEALDGWE